MKKFLTIIYLFVGYNIQLAAIESSQLDSIKVAETVNGFYNWYITAIIEKRSSEFKPSFIEAENGMTTLDLTNYLNNLKLYGFSDSLLNKERSSYNFCIESLSKVRFSEFQNLKFIDLDEYEAAKCDFGNYYRWTGGLEPVKGIRIKSLFFQTKEMVKVDIDYYETNTKLDEKYYWGGNSLILLKINDQWQIENIKSAYFE